MEWRGTQQRSPRERWKCRWVDAAHPHTRLLGRVPGWGNSAPTESTAASQWQGESAWPPPQPAEHAPDPLDSHAAQEPGVGGELAAPTSAPMIWIAGAAACTVGSLIWFLLSKGAAMGVLGWLVAGPIALGLWAVFLMQDAKRRQTGWYRPNELAEWLRRGVVVVALVSVGLNAFHIADELARR